MCSCVLLISFVRILLFAVCQGGFSLAQLSAIRHAVETLFGYTLLLNEQKAQQQKGRFYFGKEQDIPYEVEVHMVRETHAHTSALGERGTAEGCMVGGTHSFTLV